jgi:hypothetical protein
MHMVRTYFGQLHDLIKETKARSRPTVTSDHIRTEDVRSDIVIGRDVRARIVLEKADGLSSGGD